MWHKNDPSKIHKLSSKIPQTKHAKLSLQLLFNRVKAIPKIIGFCSYLWLPPRIEDKFLFIKI